ncbi:hypothetical protein [Marinoscillum sp.]|uniref:hypothetical protein n=1 Tax=Marinoscillum sp. TaxID=2024838 RepID=UPI003BAAB73B
MKTMRVFCVLMLWSGFGFSQNPELAFELNVNTVGKPYLRISILPQLNPGQTMDANSPVDYTFKLDKGGVDYFGGDVQLSMAVSRKSIDLDMHDVSKQKLLGLSTASSDFTIVFNRPLTIKTTQGDYEYSVAEISELSKGKITFTEDQVEQYTVSRGGEFSFINNNFEMFYVPAAESDTDEGELGVKFAYRNAYKGVEIFSGTAYFMAEGQVSTNPKDSLNYLSIYPVSYSNLDLEKTTEWLITAGLEGNQDLSSYRGAINLAKNMLLPNLIDLSYGYDRLRLKPVLQAGLKAYAEGDNRRRNTDGSEQQNEKSAMVFANLYYVVPIYHSFTAIVEGQLFYDFNTTINTDKELKNYYKLTMGYDVPNTEFKAFFSYQNGERTISPSKDELMSIGLLALFGN